MNTLTVSRVIRRAMLPVALLCGLLLWWNFGLIRVPSGMDTMTSSVPPGSLCIVDKRPGDLQRGQIVFLEVGEGVLLTRVFEAGPGWLTVQHDDASARFGTGAELGRLPPSRVDALVLSWFPPGDDGR